MNSLFQSAAALSISLCVGAMISTPDTAVAASDASNGSTYYGRWTVDDPEARFSTKGREYKTIDIAPCGKDFCGVSVGDSGTCGKPLFRFLSKNRNAETLKGHGKWGTAKKNVVIYNWETDTRERQLLLFVGDGYDFGDRGGNMPQYEATYRRWGSATCTAK